MDKSTLYKYISEIFNAPNVDDDTNLMELPHFNSISLMELIGVFEENNLNVDFADVLDCDSLLELYNLIKG